MGFKHCFKCNEMYNTNQPHKCKEHLLIKQDVIVKPTKQIANTNHGLELHTASYLTHKLNKNYNSVINEKICIKVGDKYILHEDIINKFKNDYLS